MRLFYFLLLVIFLAGCSSKKKLSIQAEQKAEQFEQKDVHEHKTESRDSAGQKIIEVVQARELESETETTTKIIEYDSSQPVDPATGRPPVLRETESTTKTKKKVNEDTTGKQAENSVMSDQKEGSKVDNSQSREIENNSGKLVQDNKRTFFQAPWLWMLLGGLLVLCIGYCWKKKVSPFKRFLRILKK